MVVYIVSGVIVACAAGLFWLKIAVPAWQDYDQARRPHWPTPRPPDDDLNDLLEKRIAARRAGMFPADTPINVREVA
jgi:hypothetical protein